MLNSLAISIICFFTFPVTPLDKIIKGFLLVKTLLSASSDFSTDNEESHLLSFVPHPMI